MVGAIGLEPISEGNQGVETVLLRSEDSVALNPRIPICSQALAPHRPHPELYTHTNYRIVPLKRLSSSPMQSQSRMKYKNLSATILCSQEASS
jgi:hypothetical protein